MDINLLSKLIKESLFDQDRVVISGIGYFTTEQIAAKFSEDGKSILPPHLKISFIFDKTISDDHLKKLYIHKADAKSEEAAAQWESFMEEFKENLKKEGKIEIPQIGELFYNGNNTLEFSTHDNGTLFQTVYGLEQIPIKPLTNTIPVIEMGNNLDIRDIKNESESNIGTKEETPASKEEENPATPVSDETKIEKEVSSEQRDVAEPTGNKKENTEVASESDNRAEEANSETVAKDNESEKTPKDTEDSTPIAEITSNTDSDSTSDSTAKTETDSASNTSEEGNEDTLPAVETKKSHLLRNTIIIIAAMIIIVIAAIII
ncbi:MAG: hypothetical protein J6U71_01675, partial [Bacteroidales bacterium]|nr:hypothetical protein [Bacteroidales bacterium]